MTTPIKFALNKEETTTDPVVEVQFPANAPPKPGVYEFQLVVVDNQGVASAPATLKLVLQGGATAVVRLVDANGQPLTQSSFRVGSQVFLSAKESSSENGALKSFVWKLTARP